MNEQLTGEALYQESFQRNRGIISEDEQLTLRDSRVAIPGMGGVGGIYVTMLARAGVGKFTISDPDTFDYSNINRQYGASTETIGQNKAEVMKKTVLSINPNADVRILDGGLKKENIGDFLDGCDIVIDSLDVYNFIELLALYQVSRAKGLHVLKSLPFGFGATLLVFAPSGMSFTDYFDITIPEHVNLEEMLHTPGILHALYTKWINGYTPSKLYEAYLGANAYNPFDASGKFRGQPLPSFCPTVWLCASLLTTEVVLILLKKRPPIVVPQVMEFDLYTHTLNITDSSVS